jgi:hypothetical protein
MMGNGKRKTRRQLSPEEKWEIFLEVTAQEITIAAKPASVDLRARPLAKVKTALPSVQKARRRLAAA